MFAKQTILSVSLVVVIGGPASAQPAATPPSDPPPAEARRPTGELYVGAGYNTDDKFSFGAGIRQPDLFGTGRLLALDASVSERRQRFEVLFSDPRSLGGGFVLDVSLFSDRRVLPGFTRVGTGSAVTLSHAMGDHARAFATYRFEDVRAEPDDGIVARGGAGGPVLQDASIASIRAGFEYSTLDAKVLPRRGTSLGAWIEVADPRLGSDDQLTTLHAWANTHQPIGPFTLHVGGSMTSIASRDPWGVPLTERLFLDGSSELRGYAPGSLGAIDPISGVNRGGTFAAFGRAELEAPLVRSIGLSARAFYDVGAILDTRGGGVGHSTGVGLVWRSPIGPLSLDWAVPADGPPRFLFAVGGAF